MSLYNTIEVHHKVSRYFNAYTYATTTNDFEDVTLRKEADDGERAAFESESEEAPGQYDQEEILKIINSTVSSLHPRDAHKLGAFIHVGKTGGSTLSRHLSWGCHSFVKKPCAGKTIDHETIASKTTTYYHTPDFDILLDDSKRSLYKFYVFSIRDPFERSVSVISTNTQKMLRHVNNRENKFTTITTIIKARK